MKIVNNLLLLILVALGYSCSPKLSQSSAEVNYFSSVDGTVTLRVIGEGSNQKALESAEIKVFNVLFFRGVPESAEKLAMVGTNEKEEREKNGVYFEHMYNDKRYKTFIMSATPTSGAYKESGAKKLAFDI